MHIKNIVTQKKYQLIIVVIAVAAISLILLKRFIPEQAMDTLSEKYRKPIPSESVIDYDKLEKDRKLQSLMEERKAEYGIEKGIDMVVKSDESIKIGDETVAMKDIMEETRLEQGEMIEKDIKDKEPASEGKKENYGIYVVQHEDNIWNIHFNLLKDYFERKMISISPRADEPGSTGYSSGVGKLLKFSENMVYIYNVKERNFTDNINLIHPLSKVVIYRMSEVFALLEQVDYRQVNRIQFDGETIWVPAEQ